MKNFTLFAFAVSVLAASSLQSQAAAPGLSKSRQARYVNKELIGPDVKGHPMAAPFSGVAVAADAIWRPGTVVSQINDDDSWVNYSTSAYTYNNQGFVLTCEENTSYGTATLTTNVYDSEGRLVETTVRSKGMSGEYVEGRRFTYKYDPVVKDCVVEMAEADIRGDEIIENHVEFVNITRNDAGNVTMVSHGYRSGGNEYSYDRYKVNYGSDGRASEIIFQEYYDEHDADEDHPEGWNVDMRFTDIVWDRTDGQIILWNAENSSSSEFSLYMGANRLLSAAVVDWSSETDGYYDAPLNVSVFYADDDMSFSMEAVVDETLYSSIDFFSLPNGGFDVTQFYTDIDYDDEEDAYDIDSWTEQMVEEYDAYGLCTRRIETYDDEPDAGYTTIGVVTYDSEYGYPLEYVWGERARYLFSDYKNVTGAVESVIVDPSDAAPEYFNLQGVKMNSGNLAPGLYIRRTGTGSTKVIIK